MFDVSSGVSHIRDVIPDALAHLFHEEAQDSRGDEGRDEGVP